MSIHREHTERPRIPNKHSIPLNRNNITPKSISPQQRLLSTHYFKQPLSNSRRKEKEGEAPQGRNSKHREADMILKKEKEIISRLLRTKMEQGRGKRRRWRTEQQEQLVLRKNTIAGFENLQFQILKPTDKLFHRLDNMRLAERILLAKPSLEVNRSQLSTFYKRQKNYEINIRKMPSRFHSKTKYHKSLNRKQWLD